MSDGWVDLHIHSDRSSDGSFSPFHLIHLAREKRLRAISITDHDTVAAYPEALQVGEEEGVEVIPGLELTTLYENREFHLLLPFVDWTAKIVTSLIDRVGKARTQEAKGRIKKLQEIGFDISWKEVMKKSKSGPPLGVAIAQILLSKLKKKNKPLLEKYFRQDNPWPAPYIFYEDYFMEGKPAWIPKHNPSLLDVLKIAHETGGVPVLAHPGAYFQRASKEDILIMKEHGLEGVEVYSSYHESSQTEFYKKIAAELDLVPTAGSDFHGRIKPHIPFGSLKNGEYWMVQELRKRKK